MSWTVESLFGPDPMDWDLGDAWHARSVVGDRGGVLYALALVPAHCAEHDDCAEHPKLGAECWKSSRAA